MVTRVEQAESKAQEAITSAEALRIKLQLAQNHSPRLKTQLSELE